MFKLPKDIYTISQILESHGYKTYLVGGAVRNLYGKFGTTDYDLATDAPAKKMLTIFKRVIPTGIEHGTVSVLFGKNSYEITTFRIDGQYSDLRHPDKVTFTDDIKADLSRRDYTVNGIAYDLKNYSILDPFNGRKDIDNKILKTIGDPYKRFSEDPLRILRGFRFMSQLKFKIDAPTLKAMKENKVLLRNVSYERIRDELVKLLYGKNAVDSLLAMEATGVLEIILPELAKTKGLEQKGFHSFDVFHHLIYSFEWAPKTGISIMLAALLHDIGKPAALGEKEGVPTFYHHEQIGADIVSYVLKRLKFSNAVINDVVHLTNEHMFHYTPEWSNGAVRRFIKRVGISYIDDLFALRRCDEYGFSRKPIDSPALIELRQRISKVLKDKDALGISDLKIDGNILHTELKIPKSKIMGSILKELLETVLDDPKMNNKDDLLRIAGNIYKKIKP